MMPTQREVIEARYPEHAKRILEIMGASAPDDLDKEAPSFFIHRPLTCSFVWENSPEGDSYWRRIAEEAGE